MTYELKLPDRLSGEIVFKSKRTAEAHLRKEQEIWQEFLDAFSRDVDETLSRFSHSSNGSTKQASVVFSSILAKTDSPENAKFTIRGALLPPKSDTLAGQLILGLWGNGESQHAYSVILWFFDPNLKNSRHDPHSMIVDGENLYNAALAIKALPSHQVSTQKLSAAARRAESSAQGIEDQIEAGREKIAELNSQFDETLEGFKYIHAEKIVEFDSKFSSETDKRDRLLAKAHEDLEKTKMRLASNMAGKIEAAAKAEAERQQGYEKLKKLFYDDLKIRAPAKLWQDRSDKHRNSSYIALCIFFFLIAVAITVGIALPYHFGDQIAESFFVCVPVENQNCVREFSAKGPLTLGGIFIAMSLLLWLIRLANKIYLSERHLRLDADEKRAFAETWLAMNESKDANPNNEAIILGSLFRPTQDGIIKDDEGAPDISAVAMLSKQLSK